MVETEDEHVSAREEAGFILVAVLAVLTLMALVAMTLTKTVSLNVKVIRHEAEAARIRMLADGLARMAMHHLKLNPPVGEAVGEFALNGLPAMCSAAGLAARISLANVDGLIDLNVSSPELLQRTFEGLGVTSDRAAKLATEIVEFRGASPASGEGQQAALAYADAGFDHGPKGAPFESVAELDELPAMNRELLLAARSLFTVHSRHGLTDPKKANYRVAFALAGKPLSGDEIPAPSALDLVQSEIQVPGAVVAHVRTRSTGNIASNVVRVEVRVTDRAGHGFTREADVAHAGPENEPLLLSWTGYGSDTRVLEHAGNLPACIGKVLAVE